ncbi:MAG: sugar transferase [Hyphomicrobiaceae bacterium]|nr:sugar transferase [Hyphomicrobiaceae bacterium]
MQSRYHSPTSHARSVARISFFDLAWAIAAPLLAFWLRDPGSFLPQHLNDTLVYTLVGAVLSLLAFQWFSLSDGLSRYFSVGDALDVAKACIVAVALTALICFMLTRLESAPRSIPAIHFLVLSAGLVGGRGLARIREWRRLSVRQRYPTSENIMVVGVSRLTWFYTKMVDELSRGQKRIVALVDDRPGLNGRSMAGHRIAGSPRKLGELLEEYKVHGVDVHRLVIASSRDSLAPEAWAEINRAAARYGVQLEFLPESLALTGGDDPTGINHVGLDEPPALPESFLRRPFWLVKRAMDIVLAIVLLMVLAPFAAVAAVLAAIDVGMPVLFWQQRLGRNGRRVLVYKFRTLRAPFDRNGRALSADERLSSIGRALRGSRLDEIPQLFSILSGDMSLIGPRPLLPIDQPDQVGLRLAVAPGLTGWAQVNGGKLLTPDEKNALDEWYIRHASLALEFQIMFRTAWMMVRGDRRGEKAIEVALAERTERNSRIDDLVSELTEAPLRQAS